jgi:hypothetical protein
MVVYADLTMIISGFPGESMRKGFSEEEAHFIVGVASSKSKAEMIEGVVGRQCGVTQMAFQSTLIAMNTKLSAVSNLDCSFSFMFQI